MQASELSPGQRLVIARRRLGETQAEAALRLGLPESAYCCAELDQSCVWDIPVPTLGRLRPHEKCLFERLRYGRQSQQAVANAVGVSRYWLGQMERGLANCDRLVQYWARLLP